MAHSLYVTCLSLICPVGFAPASAAAAMRARISGLVELPYVDNEGEPIVGAAVPGIDQDLIGRARLAELLLLAIEASQACLMAGQVAMPLPILFCAREKLRPGGSLWGVLAEVC